MKLHDFAVKLLNHETIEVIKVDKDYSFVLTFTHGDGLKTTWLLPRQEIERNEWRQIEEVLQCKRLPLVMHQMSRVCGYFSLVYNWNKSKRAELADRQKGNYSWPGITSNPILTEQPWPKEVVEEQLEGHADQAVCTIPSGRGPTACSEQPKTPAS